MKRGTVTCTAHTTLEIEVEVDLEIDAEGVATVDAVWLPREAGMPPRLVAQGLAADDLVGDKLDELALRCDPEQARADERADADDYRDEVGL